MTQDVIEAVVQDFRSVARVSCFDLVEDDLRFEFSPAPHERPRRLPSGWMGVYSFGIAERCLKVGKAGPKTSQRYTYQHYKPGSALSTLAASCLKHVETEGVGSLWSDAIPMPTAENVGAWLERHAWRANVLLRADRSPLLLNLLEAFVQCRLRPAFEGYGKGAGE